MRPLKLAALWDALISTVSVEPTCKRKVGAQQRSLGGCSGVISAAEDEKVSPSDGMVMWEFSIKLGGVIIA